MCLATGSSETIIYIPKSLITPPKFTKDKKESDISYPFGNTNSDTNYIPNIFVPSDLENTYKNDTYWGKYKDYIKTY